MKNKNLILYITIILIAILSFALGIILFDQCDFLVNIFAGICITSLGAILTIYVINKIIENNKKDTNKEIISILNSNLIMLILWALSMFKIYLFSFFKDEYSELIEASKEFLSKWNIVNDNGYICDLIKKIELLLNKIFKLQDIIKESDTEKYKLIEYYKITKADNFFDEKIFIYYLQIQETIIPKIFNFSSDADFLTQLVKLDELITNHKINKLHSDFIKNKIGETALSVYVDNILMLTQSSLNLIRYIFKYQIETLKEIDKINIIFE